MFVVSRGIGESLVIADQVVLTVAVAGRDCVDLGRSDLSGGRLGVLTLQKGTPAHVSHGVRGTFIEMFGERVRLGFECPPGISITRPELSANSS